jgi:hypothetical protein
MLTNLLYMFTGAFMGLSVVLLIVGLFRAKSYPVEYQDEPKRPGQCKRHGCTGTMESRNIVNEDHGRRTHLQLKQCTVCKAVAGEVVNVQ